jgi:hypothetical protein
MRTSLNETTCWFALRGIPDSFSVTAHGQSGATIFDGTINRSLTDFAPSLTHFPVSVIGGVM